MKTNEIFKVLDEEAAETNANIQKLNSDMDHAISRLGNAYEELKRELDGRKGNLKRTYRDIFLAKAVLDSMLEELEDYK